MCVSTTPRAFHDTMPPDVETHIMRLYTIRIDYGETLGRGL